MTYSARLIQTLLVFQFLAANPIHLEKLFIPKINCQDINNNGIPDFMATNNSLAPRTLYHVEINNSNIEFLWEYTMSKNISGYFSDMILGDFDNNNQLELISSAYQDDKPEIFYVFSVDSLGSYDNSPRIMGFHNVKDDVIHPQKLYTLSKNENNTQLFILTQGSPNRKVIMCEYLDDKINFVGSLGKKFLNKSLGPLSISTGNFNEDSVEDIFILNNGIKPDGYFIFSDGSDKEVSLNNYSHLKLLHKKGIDINFDEIDDLLLINEYGELMSDAWNSQPISFLDSNVNNFSLNLNNGLININTISNNGKIGQHVMDPLTKSILTSDYVTPDFSKEDSSNINSLITSEHIFLVNNDELYSFLLDNNIKEASSSNFIPKTYNKKSDFNIRVGDKFIHSISDDTLKSFLHFVGKYLPPGMDFNLNNIQLEWIPNEFQLGFHEFIYSLEVREKGEIEMEVEDDIKLVSQKENIIEGEYSYLIYVNDPVKFNIEEKKIKIVNKEPYDWIININDANVDANLNVAVIKGENNAEFQIVHSMTSEELLDSTLLNSHIQEASNNKFHQAIFSWTPNTKLDSMLFVLMVDDGFSTDTLEFITFIHPEINLSNNQKNHEYTVGQAIKIPIELEQFSPSKNYVYDLVNSPENMWINENGIIHWIPLQTQMDNHVFEVEVSDGFAFSNLQLNININAIPVISSRPSKQYYLNQGDSLSFSLESFDMNVNPQLNWELISGPKGMELNSNGTLQWLGDSLDYHSYEIQLSDGIDSVRWSGSIYVNAIPSILSKPNTIITADSLYEYEIEVIDENKFNSQNFNINNQINYELLEGPLEMSIDNNILSWQTNSNNAGEHDVSIKVSDGIDEAEQQFIILVNSIPVITSLDSISVMIGDTLNLNLKANDLNTNDSLIYTLDDLNPEMNFDVSSSLLTWIPSKSFIGDHLFNVKVLDTHDTVGTNQKLKILVYDLPKFSGDLLTEAFVGLEFSGFISGIDMHDKKMRDDVSIIIESTTIKEYKFSEYGRYFQWTPTELDIGKQEIIIRLTDDRGISNLYTHNLSVFNNPCSQCNDNLEKSPPDTTAIQIK